jgi:hypothetical protein
MSALDLGGIKRFVGAAAICEVCSKAPTAAAMSGLTLISRHASHCPLRASDIGTLIRALRRRGRADLTEWLAQVLLRS